MSSFANVYQMFILFIFMSGAEVHYAVVDCVALVREVADHQVL